MSASERKKLDKLIKNKNVQCKPKKAVVELPNDEKPLVMLKPSCVYIKQCGGCCDSPLLECLPEVVKVRKFKVRRDTVKSSRLANCKENHKGKNKIMLEYAFA